MPRNLVYNCVVCNRPKQESNHWFVALNTETGYHLHTWAWALEQRMLNLGGTEYVCGQACAHKLLDRFLEESSKIVVDEPANKE